MSNYILNGKNNVFGEVIIKMKTIFFVVSALALFVMTACKDPSDGTGSGTGTLPEAPFVEGGVSFILSPDKRTVTVKVKTAVGNVTVEGCEEMTLTSGAKAELHAQGTRITLKGNITELQCDNNQLISLNVQGLTALESLECFNNRLTALNVQGLAALQELECRNNELTALNLRGMTALQGLWCGGNKLTALNVQSLTALQTLRCNGNLFTELDVHGLKTLQNLSCKNNKLVALNVQGCTALEELECDANQLTELKVQGLRALQTLRCYDNRLTSLDVHGLRALKELECNDNLLTALNAQDCTALEKLHCRKNQLTVLNAQGCTALKGLDCLSNKLDAQAFTKLFSDLPQSIIYAYCYLYTEEKGVSEGNCKDFTNPPDLKAAFEKAKDEKKWMMYKIRADKSMVEI